MKLTEGVRLMFVATFLFALMNVFVKFVSHIPSVQVVFIRSLVSLLLSLYFLRRAKVKIWGNNKLVLVLRGLFGATALVMYFTTIQKMPLASALVLHYTAPIFTTAFTFLLLNEKMYKIQWLFLVVSFVGVGVIRNFDARVETLYLLMGIVAAMFSAAAYTCIRVLKKREHPLVIVLYFPLVTTPITGAYALTHWVVPALTDWLFLLGIGVLTQMAQLLMTKAYQAEEASRVASINYTGVLYALVFGMVFFGEFFGYMALLGMGLVMVGVVLNLSAGSIQAKLGKLFRR